LHRRRAGAHRSDARGQCARARIDWIGGAAEASATSHASRVPTGRPRDIAIRRSRAAQGTSHMPTDGWLRGRQTLPEVTLTMGTVF
jgi:hypothetical protein